MNNKSLANVRHRPQVWTQVKYFIQSQCWQNNLKNEKEESERNKNHGKDSLIRMSGFRSGQNISLDGWSAQRSILLVLSKDRLRCGPSCIVGPEDRAAKSAAALGFLPIRGRAGCSLCRPHHSGAGPADSWISHQRTSIASCSGFKALGALKALQGAPLTLFEPGCSIILSN